MLLCEGTLCRKYKSQKDWIEIDQQGYFVTISSVLELHRNVPRSESVVIIGHRAAKVDGNGNFTAAVALFFIFRRWYYYSRDMQKSSSVISRIWNITQRRLRPMKKKMWRYLNSLKRCCSLIFFHVCFFCRLCPLAALPAILKSKRNVILIRTLSHGKYNILTTHVPCNFCEKGSLRSLKFN